MNHVYWCAVIGNGDGQVVVDARKTIARHILNICDEHEGSLPRYMHGLLHNKLWLNAGGFFLETVQKLRRQLTDVIFLFLLNMKKSSAYQAFLKVAVAPLLLRDISQLLPSFQVYSWRHF
ncbi:hypothetical protein IscW_ISCW009249, partial [Ixodes scapularis]